MNAEEGCARRGAKNARRTREERAKNARRTREERAKNARGDVAQDTTLMLRSRWVASSTLRMVGQSWVTDSRSARVSS